MGSRSAPPQAEVVLPGGAIVDSIASETASFANADPTVVALARTVYVYTYWTRESTLN
jgi:hypothetical protein